ncbi:hypothetical protein [Alkalihalobacillus trypoxylicola]|uniref:Uncharacterized protein n=1 Tax=Alkalihalobacillus trypoxylicola TaxID=519424 RepID=A0A162D6B5_9BACI|nr:hypothetical protein [Alkalihalobacillus trypoxylicola]KYG28276.1 hypothetical protein AZF04_10285 [Alkalihalobacillus trypoxylicola]
MLTFIVILMVTILFPIIMILFSRNNVLSFTFDALAYLFFILFSSLAAYYVWEILRTGEVFMTTIHSLFLNPFFLIASSYLGLYVIYQLLTVCLKNKFLIK